jgi:hypothetical protein
MKAGLELRRRQTATLIERAQRAICESRKLLEQREMQLRPLEDFLAQNLAIEHKRLRHYR